MPHNPASIVRLLYGERAAEEKTAPKRFLCDFCPLQFDIRPSHPSRLTDSGGSVLALRLLGSTPFGSICCDQSAVAMGLGARLATAELALLARSGTASWTRNIDYLF
jgi:hypothetical protein